ncbi:MAG: hypothetical protein PHO36_16570, partial [Parabacteroides sp.]|nr:hypothetical protein [Parabacteroides sp.]
MYHLTINQCIGYNITHNFSRSLEYSIASNYLYVTLPDDGSNWFISVVLEYDTSEDGRIGSGFQTNVTTPGTFTGPSIKSATDAANNAASYASTAATQATAANTAAQGAKTSADNAASYASAANTNAANASSYAQSANTNTNTIINSYLSTANGIIQDASGTVLVAARGAKTSADNANSILNNGTFGLSALNTKLDTVDTNTSTQIANLDTKINNMQSTINNLQTESSPEILLVQGVNGATCTTDGTFKLIISAKDAEEYRASILGEVDSGWTTSNQITLNGISAGARTINIEARNNA